MKKIIATILLASVALSCIFVLTSCATCESCEGTQSIVCDECDGACYFKVEAYYNGILVEADALCKKCEATGKIECPDCPEQGFEKFFEDLKAKIEGK
ncbi:MAG: hypothetical protein IJX97_00600 [Clostridia bacterium]|nr:hypothetical protein [Clostridia bacterium]